MRGASLATVFFPEKKTAAECEGVVSGSATWGQPVQLGSVAAANDDVVELECGGELDDDLVDALAPFRDAETLQSLEPEIAFVGPVSVPGRCPSSMAMRVPSAISAESQSCPSPRNNILPRR